MILKWVKIGVLAGMGAAITGGLLFGTDLVSYVTSSAKSVRTAVKDSVPIEFELKRAHDLLEDMIPEMQANIRLIAQEEVAVADLQAEIENNKNSLADEKKRVMQIRDLLATQQTSYTLAGRQYGREHLKEDLARRFERFREAEVLLAGKQRLMATREKSLQSAMHMLGCGRSQKLQLEDQIRSLEGQYRLVKAASVGSHIQVDNSSLARADKLIGQIKRRLDVAERVLAHETKFIQEIPLDVINEKDLLTQVDEYFTPATDTKTASSPDTKALSLAN